MTINISEKSFEASIEAGLLSGGPDAAAPGQTAEPLPVYDLPFAPGGYLKRSSTDYDRALCLLPQDAYDFIQATQPQAWEKLKQHHKEQAREQFLKRLAREVQKRGVLHVLRQGIKLSGVKFALAYFRPSSGLNPALQKLYRANFFAVVRQLHYSQKNENSLDMVLFLNGLPLFTAELKNPLTGQTVQEAIRQYKKDRDPREPLLSYGRCLAHFAVDPNLVYVTSQLAGPATRFLPFNRGKFGGAGNPPVSPTNGGYPTQYLWREVWAKDSILDLVRQFIHEVEEEDDDGKKTGKKFLIFPRYQQLECVRKLVADAQDQGAGRRYLIQHSAGSGKSFTIAWLAHRLATLHDDQEQRVFDSIVVITDRRVLDRQLQRTMRQFEQTLGVVENIDTTSRQLKQALEEGKTIIVTTLQKFPVIADQIGQLAGQRFAVIIDEAHSSQTGESTKSMKGVLGAASLEEAEVAEAGEETPEEALESLILAEVQKRGRLPNLSLFAFTATPKSKTLELFGVPRPDGTFGPFHLYSMRQAIEEGFILDVLENYTTYTAYWRLLKKIEDDPRYDKGKATYLLKSFVDLHPHAINQKVAVMVEHFASQIQNQIGGKAKAMIVTRSRLHAVRYRLAVDKYLEEHDYPFKALVAFSGTVPDGGKAYTEANMNGFADSQTARMFERPEYRFLVVANKFQTGFDQPLLHTMYVDKKLGGVNAVQTLSRLNRTHRDKKGTAVLDFANEAGTIQAAFQPYFETTLLSEATDPALLYDLQHRLFDFGYFTEKDVDAFAAIYYDKKSTQDMVYAALGPVLDRVQACHVDEQRQFRGVLSDYVRLYAFLSQVLPFGDTDLEKLYAFARHLRRLVQIDKEELPKEIQQNIDMESYRVQETGSGSISLDRRSGKLDPQGEKEPDGPTPVALEPLSQIIAELNERFGLNLGPEHKVTLAQMMSRLDDDPALDASARANTRENVRLTFDQKVEDVIQEIVDNNFDLYKRITDDQGFGQVVKSWLFDQYLRSHRQVEQLMKQQESKTLEFKSTLRWDLKENVKNDRLITHAVLKTIAAFLNTEGGDLLIGVADNGSLVGIEKDQFASDDRFMLHLAQVVRNGLGARASTCIDPKTELVQGKTVCLVSCQRSPEPVFLQWQDMHKQPAGDFYVRSGPGSIALSPEDTAAYIQTRFT